MKDWEATVLCIVMVLFLVLFNYMVNVKLPM